MASTTRTRSRRLPTGQGTVKSIFMTHGFRILLHPPLIRTSDLSAVCLRWKLEIVQTPRDVGTLFSGDC